jgi:hypothetical protein
VWLAGQGIWTGFGWKLGLLQNDASAQVADLSAITILSFCCDVVHNAFWRVTKVMTPPTGLNPTLVLFWSNKFEA